MRNVSLWLLAVCVIAFTGCIDEKKEITLNPDGSGKIVYNVVSETSTFAFEEDKSSPADEMKSEAVKILEESKGIEAWKDISFHLTDEQKIHFTGTAYFKDLSKVNITPSGFSENEKVVVSKTDNEQMSITFHQNNNDEEEAKTISVPDNLEQALITLKSNYNKNRPMMFSVLRDLKKDTIIYLPGEIIAASNFVKVDDTTVRLKFDGLKMLEGMDSMIQDDEYLLENLKQGRDPVSNGPVDELEYNQICYGQYAPVSVEFDTSGKQQFDYEAEVSVAKANFENMLKKAGLNERSVSVVEQGDDLVLASDDAKIIGVRLISYSDSDRGIRPFNYDKGYSLSIMIQLPGDGFFVKDGYVDSAVTDTGQDILPKKKFDRKINWSTMSKDMKIVTFTVDLDLPNEDAKGLSILSGKLNTTRSTGTKEIVLDNIDFKSEKSQVVNGYEILPVEVEKSEWEGDHEQITIKPQLLVSEFIEAVFYDEKGTKIKTKRWGGFSSNGKYVKIGFRATDHFPDKGKIVFRVRTETTKHEIPFKISNVSLTGVPLK